MNHPAFRVPPFMETPISLWIIATFKGPPSSPLLVVIIPTHFWGWTPRHHFRRRDCFEGPGGHQTRLQVVKPPEKYEGLEDQPINGTGKIWIGQVDWHFCSGSKILSLPIPQSSGHIWAGVQSSQSTGEWIQKSWFLMVIILCPPKLWVLQNLWFS